MSAYEALAPFYDDLTRDISYEEFAAWYAERLREHERPIETVLDLACGTGGLTLPLAQMGFEMIAVDASPDMLAILMEKAGELSDITPPLLLCQQLPALDLFGTVDACVCCLDGMNYIPPGELMELLHRLHLFLEADGLLAFDFHSPARMEALDGQIFVDETEEVLCLWRASFDQAARQLIYGMDIFQKEGDCWYREQEEHVEYVHEPERLREFLTQAGFIDIRVYTDGPQAERGRLFLTARNTGH